MKLGTKLVNIGLSVAVVGSLAAVGCGVYAKYTQSVEGTDTARAASWDVAMGAKTFNAFETSYAADDETYTVGDTVISASEDSVIAPGTKGEVTPVRIKGTTEVAVRATSEATINLGDWRYGPTDNYYWCPISVTVEDVTLSGLDYESTDAFKAAIEAEVDKYTIDVAPNTDLGTVQYAPKVSWEWAFNQSDSDKSDSRDRQVENSTFGITIKTTLTQID